MPGTHPIIAGVAQFNPRAIGMAEAPEPLTMMERVGRAAEDSGAPDVLKSIDAVAVVNGVSARFQNARRTRIAARHICTAKDHDDLWRKTPMLREVRVVLRGLHDFLCVPFEKVERAPSFIQ